MEDDGFDSGGDYSPDVSSDTGSDTSNDIGSDYGGDLNSDTGYDLSGDLNTDDSIGEEMAVDSDSGMDEEIGVDLNGNDDDSIDDGTNENIEQPPEETEQLEAELEPPEVESEQAEIESEQPEAESEQPETEPEQPEVEPEQPETKQPEEAEQPEETEQSQETKPEQPEAESEQPEAEQPEETEQPEEAVEPDDSEASDSGTQDVETESTEQPAEDDPYAGADDLNDMSPAPETSEQSEVNEQPDSETPEMVNPKDIPDDYGSSFNDRIKQTPINDGNWDGDRGDSRWKPNDEDVIRDLRDYGNGANGVEYRNGFPDFTPVQVFECKLPNQLNERNDDYQFTDCNLALLDHLKDHPDCIPNFDDTQLAAIARGNNPSGYTWHHDVQTGRMQLVPTSLHDSCKHYGGKNVWGGGTANR